MVFGTEQIKSETPRQCLTESSDIILKVDALSMIQTKFGWNWLSGFRGEDFLYCLRQTERQMKIKGDTCYFYLPKMVFGTSWFQRVLYNIFMKIVQI
jgi:hypothetical protein